ncbi:MAG TPA: hypothetical protein VFB73_18880 [Chloroflexota bacterium]|nr:hypothetical protein [Chloroflexota bacterium]HZU08030.1 hypothetical protein [Chloroflexota bacterium]
MTRSRSPIGRFAVRALALLALALVGWAACVPAPGARVAAATAAQATPRAPTLDLGAVAAQTVALHRANRGATVNLYQGDLAGQDLPPLDQRLPPLSRERPAASGSGALAGRVVA